jgi:hypothetical protein
VLTASRSRNQNSNSFAPITEVHYGAQFVHQTGRSADNFSSIDRNLVLPLVSRFDYHHQVWRFGNDVGQ